VSLAFPTVDIEMPVKRAASIFCAVADLYIVDFGGGEPERTRREQERKAERRRLAARYVRHLVASAEVNEAAARRVIAALFDSRDADGNECACSCHPRLSSSHGDGFDCRCTWDGDRRAAEAARWRDRWDSPEAAELNAAYQREEDAIQAWLASQPGVDAGRTSSYAPQQWEGTVDGHSFYFRERTGLWRIELDLAPSSSYAQRLVRVDVEGGFVTEPVPIMEGELIAQGVDTDLGSTPVEHIAFIVRTIRDHLRGVGCGHEGARLFCADCGRRIGKVS
jgi:hypothetical protein